MQLINLQWHEELEIIEERFANAGWYVIPELDFNQFMQHLIKSNNKKIPILQERNAGRRPALVALRHYSSEEPQLVVVRLYRSNIELIGNDTPLWLGTVDYQMPHRHKFWHHKKHQQAQKGFTPAIHQVIPLIKNIKWQLLYYPIDLQPKKLKDDQQWDGGVLFIDGNPAKTSN